MINNNKVEKSNKYIKEGENMNETFINQSILSKSKTKTNYTIY